MHELRLRSRHPIPGKHEGISHSTLVVNSERNKGWLLFFLRRVVLIIYEKCHESTKETILQSITNEKSIHIDKLKFITISQPDPHKKREC